MHYLFWIIAGLIQLPLIRWTELELWHCSIALATLSFGLVAGIVMAELKYK